MGTDHRGSEIGRLLFRQGQWTTPSCLATFTKVLKKDVQVEQEGSVLQIVFVIANLHWNGQIIPAVDLRPSSETWRQSMDALSSPQFNEVVLIEQCRPGTDKAHISLDDAEQLRQFIQAAFAQKFADHREIMIGIFEQMRGHHRGVDLHGAKFGHFEEGVVSPDPIGPVQDGPFRGELNQQGHHCHRQGQHRGQAKGHHDINHSFHAKTLRQPAAFLR
jgi:hypothetical protein